MTQIHVDPQAVREFAGTLARFREAVSEEGSLVSRRLGRLGETWRDQEHERFVQEFRAMMNALDEFSADIDRAVPLLLHDAEAIETYQSFTR